MKQKFTLLLILGCFSFASAKSQTSLQAKFAADESEIVVLHHDFDKLEGLEDWKLFITNSANTWKLDNPRGLSLPNFSTIDPKSTNSLAIRYDSKVAQNEEITTPVFIAKATTVCKFHAAFDGVFSLYAPLTVLVEEEDTKTRETIFNSFLWSQESGHEKPKWLKFEFDLSKWDQKNIRIVFKYQGIDGDDVLVDAFRVVEKNEGDDAKVAITEGSQVHYKDISLGTPTSWEWTFEGGLPATSTEQNPVVIYPNAGEYKVSLKVKNSEGENETIKQGFVTVQGVAPIAAFDFPTAGYLSPEVALFIPVNHAVTFTDKSKNAPRAWTWTLPGTEATTYTDQNPVVKYPKKGKYDAKLEVSNSQGKDMLDYQQVIQVGDTAHIWNIGMAEANDLAAIDLSWYGFYGGTNYLDMYAFAERYEKPLVKGSISELDIYFERVEVAQNIVDIKVSIAKEKDGLPGEILETVTLPSNQLVYDANTWLPTTFKFTKSIEIDEPFYVIVDGFPQPSGENLIDDIVMGAVLRDSKSDGVSTVYHYGPVFGEEEKGSVWLKNSDEKISFAISPRFAYSDTGDTGIATDKDSQGEKPLVFLQDGLLKINPLNANAYSVDVYSIAGVAVAKAIGLSGNETLTMPFASGVYIVKIQEGGNTWTYKVQL